MKKLLILALLISSVGFPAKKKHKPRIPRKAMIEKDASEYTVQEGDWLSSIADSYFGNKSDWKKIAQKNPEIRNPNLIHPGEIVSLNELREIRNTASLEQDLPTLTPFDKRTRAKEIDIEQPLIHEKAASMKMRIRRFIVGQEEVWGEITGSTEERKFFLPGDKVYVKSVDLSKFQIGAKLSVAKSEGPLEDRTVSKSQNLGDLMELVGEIEVIEHGENFVKCEVSKAYGKIEREDKILTLVPSVTIGEKIKPPSDLTLKVVMMDELDSKFAHHGSLILLNKGWEKKVAPDQYFRIFSDIDPVTDTHKKIEPESKGEVQIIYAGKTASVGLVTRASKSIQLGDALVPYQHFSDPKPAPQKQVETIEID